MKIWGRQLTIGEQTVPNRSVAAANAGQASPWEPPPAPPTPTPPAPAPEQLPAPAVSSDIGVYRGLGAWVDLYDIGQADSIKPEAILDELARRGVRTLYLQTGRWTSTTDIAEPEKIGTFLDLSHARGLKVVGWYLPGFGDIDRDLRRSLAVLEFASPSGQRFDGFAPDIEDRVGVSDDRIRFNHGIIEYSERLRAAVPPGTVIGAIVPDAKNNERAREYWAGFPWPEIGRSYDAVLPMAYWSVIKKESCRNVQMDAASYVREVIDKTQSLMATGTPMHPIAGIADCSTLPEIAAYVNTVRETGAIGGSLYDFVTNNSHPARDALWAELSRLNEVLSSLGPRQATP